jgi:zinc protease
MARRLGAGQRIQDKAAADVLRLADAERLPIGKPEILRTAPAARLRAFYDTRYRPELMAIVAVGDIDAAQAEQAIVAAFGPIAVRAPAEKPPNAQVPLHSELLVNVATDPELTSSSVRLVTKQPAERPDRVGDYRPTGRAPVRRHVERSVRRTGPQARCEVPGAGGGGSSLTPTVQTFSLQARVPDGSLLGSLNVRDRGPPRARAWLPVGARSQQAQMAVLRTGLQRATRARRRSADEYPALPRGRARSRHRYVSPRAERPARHHARGSDDARALAAVGPEPRGPGGAAGEAGPAPALGRRSRSAITAAKRGGSHAVGDTTRRARSSKDPEPARVESRRELANIGVTVVRFANGVEAWLKPTDFKNDQVVFTMYSLGGASLAPRTDFVDASLASSYVGASGAGGLKALDLQRVLAGKLAAASPFISSSTHGINGSAAPAELQTALQLLYQFVVAPGDDPEAFALMKRQLEASIANRGRSPGQVFGERIEQINASNHYTADPLTAEDIRSLDRAKMMSFYRAFCQRGRFHVLHGRDLRDRLGHPVARASTGTLPSTGKKTAEFKDIGVRFPAKVITDRVEKGREPQSRTVISFFADPSADPVDQERVGAATTVLEIALRDTLREELGQTYTVSVGLAQSLPQRGDGHTQVSFGAAPENINSMTERVIQEVRRLQDKGPSEDLTSRAKESARRTYETALRQNSYWMQRLRTVHMLGRDPGEILTRIERINAVTPAIVQEAFRKYFPLDRYTVVTLVPEPAK